MLLLLMLLCINQPLCVSRFLLHATSSCRLGILHQHASKFQLRVLLLLLLLQQQQQQQHDIDLYFGLATLHPFFSNVFGSAALTHVSSAGAETALPNTS